MKKLDLEKAIILISLLLMPVAGGWVYFLDQDLKEADIALGNCKATILKIFQQQKYIDLTNSELNQRGEDVKNFDEFFEKRLIASMGGNNFIKTEEMTVNEGRKQDVRKGNTRKVIGKDIEVRVEFGKGKRGGMPLTRSFVNAFLVNCEARAPIWKLRSLKVTNKDFKGLRRNSATPPLETTDEWFVNTMIFARRKPADSGK